MLNFLFKKEINYKIKLNNYQIHLKKQKKN